MIRFLEQVAEGNPVETAQRGELWQGGLALARLVVAENRATHSKLARHVFLAQS